MNAIKYLHPGWVAAIIYLLPVAATAQQTVYLYQEMPVQYHTVCAGTRLDFPKPEDLSFVSPPLSGNGVTVPNPVTPGSLPNDVLIVDDSSTDATAERTK